MSDSISLNRLTFLRAQGADKLVVTPEVMHEHIDEVSGRDAQYLIENRLFPFNRCLVEFPEDNHRSSYFERVSENEIAIIRDSGVRNTIFSAIIDLNELGVLQDAASLSLNCSHIRVAAFRNNTRLSLSPEMRDRAKQILGIEAFLIICIFFYINSISLKDPDIEERPVREGSRKKTSKHAPIRYISTKKYTLTGNERKSRRQSPKIYTQAQWQVRGHWRKYKSGKQIWINPHVSNRHEDKLTQRKQSTRIYKVTS